MEQLKLWIAKKLLPNYYFVEKKSRRAYIKQWRLNKREKEKALKEQQEMVHEGVGQNMVEIG